MKKQLISFILVVVVALTLSLPVAVFAAQTSEAQSSNASTHMPASQIQDAKQDSTPGQNISFPTYTVHLDGILQEYVATPIIAGNTAMVPVKDFCESLGLDMTWSDFRKEITISNDRTVETSSDDIAVKPVTIILKLGSPTALVNNKLHTMPNTIITVNCTAFAPIKSLSETFGINVSWNATSRQVLLTSPMPLTVSTESAVSIKPTAPTKSASTSVAATSFLNYENAVTQGIRKSPSYQSALLSSDKAKKRNEELYLDGTTYNLTLLRTKQNLKMYDTWAEKQVTITAEQIGNNVKNQMDDLSLMFVQKKNQEYQIDFLAEKLRIENLKYDLGTSSVQNLQSIQSEYNVAVQNLIILEQNISAAYVKLNQTLGYPADYRNRLEYKVEYSPVEKVDLDKKILNDQYEDPYIWYAGQNVESKEFALVTYEYNAEGQSWTLSSLDLTEAKKNLNDTKTALAGVIRDRYNTLLQLEDNVKLLELNLEKAKDAVNFVRLQYDLGYATKQQVEESQQAIPGIQYQIQSLKQQHEQMKMLFEKPYLAPTYAAAS